MINYLPMNVRRALSLAVAVLLGGFTPLAYGQVVAPSTYTTAIQVQGEPVGAEFADWAASGIPIAVMDPLDNPDGDPPYIDLANVQIANDDQFIYLHLTMHNPTTSLANLYLAFDTDQDTSTGFNVFSLGAIGSEFGYQTDFPFAQATSVFNTGVAITGGPLSNGGALIYPFWTDAGAPVGNEIEWAVPRDAMITLPAAAAFPNDSFNLMIWTDTGISDATDVISYTLADAPPPAPGDFDADQDVDGEDFLLWQRGFGSTFDASDLVDWKTAFGQTAGVAAVPEPACAALVAAMLLAVAHRAPRRSTTPLVS
jgi:hypothetical protein